MAMLGIDWGSRRIGLAVSHSESLATAYAVVHHRGDAALAADRISSICSELEIDRVILGIPRTQRRDSGQKERQFNELAELLRQKTCRQVVLWDETLSTVEAAVNLHERGIKRKKAAAKIDMEAARVILQSYLDELARRAP